MINRLPRVRTGLDRLVDDRFHSLRGQRVGAICNPTAVDHEMRHLADHLHAAANVKLSALFGPEHGIRGDAQDMIGVASSVDARTGVIEHSLYGSDVSSLTPSSEQLDGLDALVFDVQDVGSRYYTFAATMLYAMTSAAGKGMRFVVLDRPNPIGGDGVEGPTVQLGFESFVGAYPMPIRHGMTVGELAMMFRAELKLNLDLEVVPCLGWSRSMFWRDTGLPWVSPSPNMPTPETAIVYPGGCLIEGTNLSEGRGTTRPFELWGAPWLDPQALADAAARTPGSHIRPCAFRPMFHKHAGEVCLGAQPHVYDPGSFSALRFFTLMLDLAHRQNVERFAWRTEPYEFVTEPIAIDLLFGSSRERSMIESGEIARVLGDDDRASLDHWKADEQEFRARRQAHLIYD
jgi:uncharacterized protein YbbC (DUF1343 family)